MLTDTLSTKFDELATARARLATCAPTCLPTAPRVSAGPFDVTHRTTRSAATLGSHTNNFGWSLAPGLNTSSGQQFHRPRRVLHYDFGKTTYNIINGTPSRKDSIDVVRGG